MNFVQGFVLAVPTANREVYAAYAARMWPLFRKYGALRLFESWGVEVPDGKLTSFPMAVKLAPDETVVFAWIEWPDRDSAMRCHGSFGTDPDWEMVGDVRDNMPFDGVRMIFGDFVPIVDLRA
ncbi:MAG TPA: DUF1428 domain-containing protein [Paracoccaceae bacterium]|nr:DUF1428 domain-containing protein [Paracoccaceae bacterium]HMO71147.1 DUF1428 domain-containing protein [Paracoccaceae bacterium]